MPTESTITMGRRVFTILACASVLTWVWPGSSVAAVDRTRQTYAMIIGYNGSPDPGTPALRYADDDAIAYAELFRENGATVRLHTEVDAASAPLHQELELVLAPPTRTSIRDALESLRAEILAARGRGAETVLFFVYAGHGDVRHGEGFVMLADGPLNRRDFYALIDLSPADRNHVILDACKSYYLVFERGDGVERTAYHASFDDQAELTRRASTGFILSTSSAQNSHEWEEYQAGIFSHEVRSGLRGGADADLDGRISYAELAAFVFAANRAIPNEKYRPNFLALPPAETPILFEPSTGTPALVLDAGTRDHLFVEDNRGVRILDVHPDGQRVVLRVDRQRPSYLRDPARNLEYALPRAGRVRLSALKPDQPRTARRGAEHDAFKSLFRAPFGKDAIDSLPGGVLRERLSLDAPPPAPAGVSPWVWATAGVAAASTATGAAFRLLGDRELERYRRASVTEQPALRRSTQAWDDRATASFILAGTAALSSVVLYLVLDDP
jgi:hypothetical protein